MALGGGADSYERDTHQGFVESSWEVLECLHNLIAASIHDKYSVGPSILPILTR